MRTEWRDGDRIRSVELSPRGHNTWRVKVDESEFEVQAEPLDDGRLRLAGPDGVQVAEVTVSGSRRFVRLGAMDFVLERLVAGRRRAGGPVGGGLEAPMPGVVTKVLVAAGDAVSRGQPLVAVEAMKMEHLIRAPREGRVAAVRAKPGEMVNPGVALVDLEEIVAG